MGVIQTSKRVPRNLNPSKRVPDAQANANTDAFSLDPPQDKEYGNLGPEGSAQAPDKYGENDHIVMGCNEMNWQKTSPFTKEDVTNNNKMRTSSPKKANAFPGGGW